MIQLMTERLIIREHCMSDIKTHHDLLSNDEVMNYLQDIKAYNLEQSRVNLQVAVDEMQNENRTMYFFRMEDKFTGEHIGEIGYTVTAFTAVGKLVEFGYFIHKKFWGNGYVTEAFKKIMSYAFEENDVYRISAGCIAENARSERVMQKCGMFKEAHCKEKQWHDGKMKDRVEYRLLKSEYFESLILCDPDKCKTP